MNCQHLNFETRKNIGFDISCDYEERQHMDICPTCKARRFWADVLVYGKNWEPHHKEWEEDTPESYWNNHATFGQFS
jgi:hypothetical protein